MEEAPDKEIEEEAGEEGEPEALEQAGFVMEDVHAQFKLVQAEEAAE